MSTTTRPDLEVIEALDFEHVPPCEHSQHGLPEWPEHNGPAGVFVLSKCTVCPRQRRFYLCMSFWEYVVSTEESGECVKCGVRGTWRDFYTVLGWVNS